MTKLAIYRAEVRQLRAAGVYVTSRVRCAARYAALADRSITEAARDFHLTPGAVWLAWERVFPHLPHPLGNQTRGRTQHALELIEGGLSVRNAAEVAGVSRQAVYDARRRRRAEARAA